MKQEVHDSKPCYVCRVDLPLTAYGPDSRRPDGVNGTCRQCRNLAKVNKKALRQKIELTKELESTARMNAVKRLVELHTTDYLLYLNKERAKLSLPRQTQWTSIT